MNVDGEVAAYVERLPVGVFRSTRAGELVMANQALAGILGLGSVEEMIGARTTDFYIDPADRERAILRADSGQDLGLLELWLKRNDGTPFLAPVRSKGVTGDDGRIEYLDGVIEDITEAHETREWLAVSEALFRTAFEQSPSPMILMTPELETVAVNAATCDMLQIIKEDFLGTRSFADVGRELGRCEETGGGDPTRRS